MMDAAAPTPTIPIAKCWAWIGCSETGGATRFSLDPGYVAGGPAWLAAQCRAMHALGCAGVSIHLPFGASSPEGYSFTMAAALRAAGPEYAKLINGFASHIAPVVRDGIRVVPYLGSLRLSPELDRLTLEKLDDRMRLLAENIKPICEAGMHALAIDGSVGYAPDSDNGRLLDWWRSIGLTIWLESNPADWQSWYHDQPIFVENDTYLNRLSMPQYATVRLTGPVMRFVKSPNGDGMSGEDWGRLWARECVPQIRAILADGHVPCCAALDLAVRYAPGAFTGAPL